MTNIHQQLVEIEDLIKEMKEVIQYDNFKINDAQKIADEISGIASGFWSSLSDIESKRWENNWVDEHVANARTTSNRPLSWSEIKRDYEDNYGENCPQH